MPAITYGDGTIRDGDPVVWLDEQGIPQEADEEHPHGVLIGRTADEPPLAIVRPHTAYDSSGTVKEWHAPLDRIELDAFRKRVAAVIRRTRTHYCPDGVIVRTHDR
ncbi:hypothetical protein OG948_18055 [Embleya sp. NBC_00888]|uniref:hypothetical protein n=1 Tax=Embleya sp. NBC_00888 TaxID=2975960 RepID=UPI00386A5822|nr:hypothetical protein OG948_18055 [Embleya sp. NBC_00888]